MKKFGILSILFALIAFSGFMQSASAQCTPNPPSTTPGIYPDPFPEGCVNQPYSEVAQFVFPYDTTVNQPPFGTFTIPFDSFQVLSVTNVPTGLSFVLNSPNGKYYPSGTNAATGCADVTGLPTVVTLPTDSIEVELRVWLTVPIIGSTTGVDTLKAYLKINATPTAAFTAGMPTGNVVSFANSSTGASSYDWDFGDGSTDTTMSPTHTFPGPGNYNVCLIADNGNCQDTTCQNVTIGCPAPTVTWTESVSGLTVDFTDNTITAPGTVNWLWDFGDGNTSTTQNPSHTYAASGPYTVCLTISDACGTDSTCGTANPCDLPVAGFTTTPNSGMVSFTNTSTNATSYMWDFGNGSTDTTANPTSMYTMSGTYTVCLIAGSACGMDTICNQVNVCVDPGAGFTFVDNSGTVDFTDASVLTGTATYLWDFGDGSTSTMPNPTHAFTAVGNYTVCLEVSDSCASDTSCQTVNITIANLEDELFSQLQLFPNPNNGQFTLRGTLREGSEVQVRILDLPGRVLMNRSLGMLSGEFNQSISLEGVKAGIYFVQVSAGARSQTIKVMVQ